MESLNKLTERYSPLELNNYAINARLNNQEYYVLQYENTIVKVSSKFVFNEIDIPSSIVKVDS